MSFVMSRMKTRQDARHDLGVERLGVVRDDDVSVDGGIGGEVELDETAVLVLPHEPAREQRWRSCRSTAFCARRTRMVA